MKTTYSARRLAGGVAAVAVLALAGAVPAQAAPTTCRGSAAKASAGGTVTSEPVIANPTGTPCTTQSQQVAGVVPVGGLSVSDPKAATRGAPGIIAASGSVDGASLSGGGSRVSVGHVAVSQVQSCTNGANTSGGTSTVDGLVIGGQTIEIVGSRPIDQTIGPVRVRTNQLSGSTRRALVLDFGSQELVLGEATAAGDACATLAGGGDGPGDNRICPLGSTYDVERNLCVIVVHDSSGRTIDTVGVGRPYQGPAGGRVVALSTARGLAAQGKLPKSPCLRGKGPRFVVLGTAHRDRITGTNRPDRIIGRGGNDDLDGGRGKDCVDGGKGNDVATGGLANDRLYGGVGRDHVNGDSGSDREYGGRGNDTINTGFGRDRAFGGAGNDKINAATAGKPARIRGGRGRDTVRINRNERGRVNAAERVYVIR